jgi:hypothetical protein
VFTVVVCICKLKEELHIISSEIDIPCPDVIVAGDNKYKGLIPPDENVVFQI